MIGCLASSPLFPTILPVLVAALFVVEAIVDVGPEDKKHYNVGFSGIMNSGSTNHGYSQTTRRHAAKLFRSTDFGSSDLASVALNPDVLH